MAEVELDDVHKLRAELQSLHDQKAEVNERLNAWHGGRGRGRGLPPHDGAYGRASDGAFRRDGRTPGFNGRQSDSYRGGISSSYQGQGTHLDSGRRAAEPVAQAEAASAPVAPAPKKLMSAIVINGQAKIVHPQAQVSSVEAAMPAPYEGPGTAKRPAPSKADRDPAAQKRARRMFGALMGTLARASAEEQKFQETGGAAKRQTAMQRVREREREQRAQARQAAIERERAERQAEILRKRELTAMEEVKRAEIMAAERLRHRVVLSHYIRTSAGPPLHWLPAVATPATDALLAREKERLEIWKAAAVERVEAERVRILAARAPQLLPQEEPQDDASDGDVGADAGDRNEDAGAAAAKDEVADGAGDRWQASVEPDAEPHQDGPAAAGAASAGNRAASPMPAIERATTPASPTADGAGAPDADAADVDTVALEPEQPGDQPAPVAAAAAAAAENAEVQGAAEEEAAAADGDANDAAAEDVKNDGASPSDD